MCLELAVEHGNPKNWELSYVYISIKVEKRSIYKFSRHAGFLATQAWTLNVALLNSYCNSVYLRPILYLLLPVT